MAKILIVDDEPRIRELIHEHLQYAGYICGHGGSQNSYQRSQTDCPHLNCRRSRHRVFGVFRDGRRFGVFVKTSHHLLCFSADGV